MIKASFAERQLSKRNRIAAAIISKLGALIFGRDKNNSSNPVYLIFNAGLTSNKSNLPSNASKFATPSERSLS